MNQRLHPSCCRALLFLHAGGRSSPCEEAARYHPQPRFLGAAGPRSLPALSSSSTPLEQCHRPRPHLHRCRRSNAASYSDHRGLQECTKSCLCLSTRLVPAAMPLRCLVKCPRALLVHDCRNTWSFWRSHLRRLY
jgi:hypothetical protein